MIYQMDKWRNMAQVGWLNRKSDISFVLQLNITSLHLLLFGIVANFDQVLVAILLLKLFLLTDLA